MANELRQLVDTANAPSKFACPIIRNAKRAHTASVAVILFCAFISLCIPFQFDLSFRN